MSDPTVATPPAPAATPPEAPPTERAPADFMADVMGDFENISLGKPPIERDDKGKFVKPADKPPTPPAEKPPEQPPAKPAGEKPPEKATETEPPKPVKAAELRTAYEGLKKKVKEELEPEVQKLRAKVKEYETKPPEDTAPILQKMKAIEDRNAALERHIQYVDYQQSGEFVSKYDQPYREAWDLAVSEFKELAVREQEGTDDAGEPVFKSRAANEKDLLRLGNMSLSDMDSAATAMFGASAPRAIRHIEDLKRLSAAKNKALSEAQTKAGEWRSQQQIQAKARTDTLAKTWTETNKGLEEKFPKAFKADDADAEDKASHTKGFALADLLFTGEKSLNAEQIEALPAAFKDTVKAGKAIPDIQRVQLHAIARLKMANHDRKVAALKKATDRIAELEKALSEYEKSEPTADRAGSGTPASSSLSPEEQVEAEIRALDK